MNKYLVFELLIEANVLSINELINFTILSKETKTKLNLLIVKKIKKTIHKLNFNKPYVFFQTSNILQIENNLYNLKMNCSECKILLFENVKILFGIPDLYCKNCFKNHFITKSELLTNYRIIKPYLHKILRWKNRQNHYVYIKRYIYILYYHLKYLKHVTKQSKYLMI